MDDLDVALVSGIVAILGLLLMIFIIGDKKMINWSTGRFVELLGIVTFEFMGMAMADIRTLIAWFISFGCEMTFFRYLIHEFLIPCLGRDVGILIGIIFSLGFLLLINIIFGTISFWLNEKKWEEERKNNPPIIW